MPCQCQPLGRPRKRSMRSDPRMSLPGLVICLWKVSHRARTSSGPSFTHAMHPSARTKPKPRLTFPKRIKSGTTWARHRPRRRHSTQKIHGNLNTIRNAAFLTASLNRPRHPDLSISHLTVPPTHHRREPLHKRNLRSHTSTSLESRLVLHLALLSPHRNSLRALPRQQPVSLRCHLARILDSLQACTLRLSLRRCQRVVHNLRSSARAARNSHLCHHHDHLSNFSNPNSPSLSTRPGYHIPKPTAPGHRQFRSRRPNLRDSRVSRLSPQVLVNHQTSQCSSTWRPCHNPHSCRPVVHKLPYSMSHPPFLSTPGKSSPSSRPTTTGKKIQ